MRSDRLDVRLDTCLESLLEYAPEEGRARVLATLVATAGSTYRKPGARMLIMADSHVGLLSGGCLEADLKLHAREVLESGVARAVEYDMRGPDDVLFGLGSGCKGAMRILLEPAGPGSLAVGSLREAGRVTRQGQAASLVAVHESTHLALGTYQASSLDSPALLSAAQQALNEAESRDLEVQILGRPTRVFVHYLAPPPHVLVCGAGPDAEPVVRTALGLGWRVAVVDHRPAYAIAQHFPGADVRLADARDLRSRLAIDNFHAAVVMNHHLASDMAYLREFAEAGVPGYVGLLGPKARRYRIVQELGATAENLRHRIHGPVGIDIGAITPEAIALAIVSQMHAWLAGRDMPDCFG